MATKTLQVNSSGAVSWDYEKDFAALSVPADKAGVSFGQVYKSTDTGSTKGTKILSTTVSIANGAANTTINLASFTDCFGDTINMAIARVIHIECTAGDGVLVLGGTLAALVGAMYTGLGLGTNLAKVLVSGAKWIEERTTNTGLNTTNQVLTFQNGNTGNTFNCKIVVVGE